MKWNFLFAFLICSFALVINVCSIVVLYKTKTLNKTRFYFLVLLLSISDSTISIHYILHTVFNYMDDGSDTYLYGCMIFKQAIGGTFGFSIFQILMICLERLHATFTSEIKILRKLTSNTTVGLAFFMFPIFNIIPLIIEMQNGPHPCVVDYSARPLYVISVDCPVILCLCLIISIYFVVIVRIVKKQRKVLDNTFAISIAQQNTLKRMKRNAVTLGIIILVTSISFFPREMIAIWVSLTGKTEGKLHLMILGNHLTLINPLIDPIIYILRFKQIRDLLLCACKSRTAPVTLINVRPIESSSILRF